MRITVEIDDSEMRRIQQYTGQKKKSPAVSQALTDYLEAQERRRFVAKVLAGKTDYSATNEELEAQDRYETR